MGGRITTARKLAKRNTMSKQIFIKRIYEKHQTKGVMTVTVDGINTFTCRTLELKDNGNKRGISCIPEGDYVGVIRYSKKYARHIHILDVPNRDFILIHWGNYAGSINAKTGTPDIKGCVLAGKGYADLNKDGICDITDSKKTFAALMAQFPDDKEQIFIRIRS